MRLLAQSTIEWRAGRGFQPTLTDDETARLEEPYTPVGATRVYPIP
jgi:hypothetical protein